MSKAFTVRTLAAIAAIALSSSAFAAQARLGFSVAVNTDGLFSHTLKQVRITAVAPGAPAEQAGLKVDDDVQSINDVRIAGTDGSKIMDMVHAVQPGEHLKLKVLRGGVEHVVDIVGGAAK